jgi:hypothetical protein
MQFEIADRLLDKFNIIVSCSTISRTLASMELTNKKVQSKFTMIFNWYTKLHFTTQITKVAAEQDDLKRSDYILYIGTHFKKEQLVFLDETGVNTRNTSRKKGWSQKGTRCVMRVPHARGKRFVHL